MPRDAQGPIRDEYNGFSFYDVPLTAAMKAELEKWPEVIGPLVRESKRNARPYRSVPRRRGLWMDAS